MARRQSPQSEVLLVDDWSTVWRCACGYGNAGRDRCLMCGAPAPTSVQGTAGLHAEAETAPGRDPEPQRDQKTGRKAGRTVAAIIVLNLILQVSELVYFAVNDTEPATAIRFSLITGLVFYGLCAAWTMWRSATLAVHPVLGLVKKNAVVGAAEGFVVGGASAALLFAVLRLAAGHPVLDPSTAVLAVQGSVASLVLGALLLAVAAPVVEELVFRGFLAEALRPKGKRTAVILSAIAFSLAHLRLAAFRYYVLVGIVLAFLYFRRGLVGSVAAHATFNGMLLLLAITASHGPLTVVHHDGESVAVPATYHTATDTHGDDIVATGPIGARAELAHADLPVVVPIDRLASDLSRGAIPFPPGLTVYYATTRLQTLPAGQAVVLSATVNGKDGRLVVLPHGNRLWIVVFRSDGSSRSFHELDQMLRSWKLPPI